MLPAEKMTASRWRTSPLREMRAAVLLLTRLPVGGFPYADAEWRGSAAYFPAVGAALGLVFGAAWLSVERAGSLVSAVFVVVVSLFVTGALHEDGLADTADALGGAASRERVLAILKDSRVGSYGALAIVCTVLFRVALLARLGAFAPTALVVTACVSRASPVWLMASLPYVTDRSVAKSGAVMGAGLGQAAWATSIALAVTAGLVALRFVGAVPMAIAWAGAFVVFAMLRRTFALRVGGVTGDFLGACQQSVECAMLFVFALAVPGKG